MEYSDCIPCHGPTFPYGLFYRIARDCSDDDILVEVGVGFGHGTVYMMECLVACAKHPWFYAFDLFDMRNAPEDLMDIAPETPWGELTSEWQARNGGAGARLDQFLFHLRNVRPAVRERLTDFAQFPSISVANGFKPDTVSFVFLNASRTPAIIEKELAGWWKAIKAGGKLAIYNQPGLLFDFAARHNVERHYEGDNTDSITKPCTTSSPSVTS